MTLRRALQHLARGLDITGGECVRNTRVHGLARKTLQLVVRPEEIDLDTCNHLGDRLVGDVREDRLAEHEEVEVRRVPEIKELEVVVPQLQSQAHETVVVVLECVARTEAGTGLHNFIRILNLRQRIELE